MSEPLRGWADFSWVSRDARPVLLARGLRTFGYGFLSVLLAIYLDHLGLSTVKVGVVLTATLIGAALLAVLASLLAERIGRRRMLIFFAILMGLSRPVFMLTSSFPVLMFSMVYLGISSKAEMERTLH